MTAYIKIGGTYEAIPNAGLYLKRSSSYTDYPVVAGYVKVGTTYRQFFTGSDPKIYTFVASNSKAARGTSWASGSDPSSTYPRQGRYSTNYPWYGVFTFGNDTNGVSLASRLNTRPVVKSASISFKRWSSTHGFWPNGWGDVYVGRYDASINAVTPNPGNTNFTYYGLNQFTYGGSMLELGDTFSVNLASVSLTHAQSIVDHAETLPLCVANTNDESSASGGLAHYGSSEDTDYFIYYPYDFYSGPTPKGPVLTVELDYV